MSNHLAYMYVEIGAVPFVVFLLCGAKKGTKIKDMLWYGVSVWLGSLLRYNITAGW